MSITINGATGEISSAVPAGLIMFYASSTLPTGFLKCNGAAVSRTTYSALFTAIGTTFGSGDGSTTFNLPDMRGYFPRGWVDNGTVDSGRSFGSTQTDAFQSHIHTVSQPNWAVGYGSNGGQWGTNSPGGGSPLSSSSPATDGSYGTPRVATETRPVNIALLACIKY